MTDGCCLTLYFSLLFFLIYIVIKYLIPLRIKSPYILMFYGLLSILLLSQIIVMFARLVFDDPGFYVTDHQRITVGMIALHTGAVAYILLGFVISVTMFQLSVSLALVLCMIDVKEANTRKMTFNVAMLVIGVATIICACFETSMSAIASKEHLIFEVIGLLVLCLVYFTTIVELLRRLRIFVLDESKQEARLIRLQFWIFLAAYGSKVITLMYWIKNPPKQKRDVESFLIVTDAMQFIWIFVPTLFLLLMQIRTFMRMKEEKLELLAKIESH